MKIFCAPPNYDFTGVKHDDLAIVLYGPAEKPQKGSAGASLLRNIIKRKMLAPDPRAWDLLSIALSVTAADKGVYRRHTSDGWTRQLDLYIAVSDPNFWSAHNELISRLLQFLTTDQWTIHFIEGGILPEPPEHPAKPPQDCIVLLSGGLDSLVGAIDIARHGHKPYAVSQLSRGDREKQICFASNVCGDSCHLQLNHSTNCLGKNEISQRSRSFIFLAYGVLMATSLASYHRGKEIVLYICENGFISINPPLAESRIGSLSTRTTHPYFVHMFQQLLVESDLRISIKNPYQFVTKGEMLKECDDQNQIKKLAHTSTSCSRFLRYGYEHCGRCLPCLIRRAAFLKWDYADQTSYSYSDLCRDDKQHARYDDVRATALAVSAAEYMGIRNWAGPALSSKLLGDTTPYEDVVKRGIRELSKFLEEVGVL